MAMQGELTWACGLIFLGALFDVFDGLAARALGGGTPLGAQLDSLADMVTFGMAPASALCAAGVMRTDLVGPVIAAAIVLVIGSCWRLAKFNLDTRQTSGFLGLPTPANGMGWAALVLGSTGTGVIPGPGHLYLTDAADALLHSPYSLLALAVLMAALMLSELPLPSLKFKHSGWKGNEVIFLLMGMGLVLVLLYGIMAVPLILALYLLSPVWGRVFGRA